VLELAGLALEFLREKAPREAVKLVEKAIADYRDRLKQSSVAAAVAGLLNLFTEHAWSEAVTLTYPKLIQYSFLSQNTCLDVIALGVPTFVMVELPKH